MEVLDILNVILCRDVDIVLKQFQNYFKGFEKVEAVMELFGTHTQQILNDLLVEFVSSTRYMRVSNDDGHLIVGVNYLKNGDERDIYLDIIHELVHVKQFHNGLKLHDRRFRYPDRPTEIEAFSHAVKEARRLGMTDTEIYEYLKVEWITEEEVKNLATVLNVKI